MSSYQINSTDFFSNNFFTNYLSDEQFSKAALNLQALTTKNGQGHTIYQLLLPTNCLSAFDHFVGLVLKVACVVKIIFFFVGWFYYNLVILIRYCKIPYKNLDKPGIFSGIWKLWRAPTTLRFNIFCWNFIHVFYLPMSTKGCVKFFYFIKILSYLQKFKDLVSTHSLFTLLLITVDLDKIKKNSYTFL